MPFPDFVRVNGGRSCPCCGAPLTGPVCDYCGKTLVDFACMETTEPFYLKVRKQDGTIHVFHVQLRSIEIESPAQLWADDNLYLTSEPDLCVRMTVLPE